MFLSNAINNIETNNTVKLSVSDNIGIFRFRIAEQPSVQLTFHNSIFDNTVRLTVAEDSTHNFSSLSNVSTVDYTDRVRELERRIEELKRIMWRGGHNNASQ